ncbi:glycosyltransferase [Flavobacterium sp.]|uniref:glycosyltransferase n=1 Tax=Flavobacterium sp. TaxID=239 RepID=UPI002C5AD147|nr:glycosyltransferase [Flavobacterium sp.]HSD07367.1 glycosyltransferase [Flavobacterium sp.]
MKILFVSMPSVHVIRWIENLKDTPYELFWFDVLGRGKLEAIGSLHQFTGWKKRKLPFIKGEYFLSKKFPVLYEKMIPYLEVTADEALEKIILEIQPDIVHGFELHYCSYPILKTMKKYPDIKWIYSCWGNDIFRHQVLKSDLNKIQTVLRRVDFLITDCKRDFHLAEKYGFKGNFLGVLPGGTGYDINNIKLSYKEPTTRKIILIKGYQNEIGRAIFVLKAIKAIIKKLETFEIYVFSARGEVADFILSDSELNGRIKILDQLSQIELFSYFGRAFMYIGNNISDGMPNTLLESLLLGAYPLQSNPGNATKELIGEKYFGMTIDNPEDSDEIASKILQIIDEKENIVSLVSLNHKNAIGDYDYNKIKNLICGLYNLE